MGQNANDPLMSYKAYATCFKMVGTGQDSVQWFDIGVDRAVYGCTTTE